MNTTLIDSMYRPLTKDDINKIVDIDARIYGRHRPGFFEKRLSAAFSDPQYFIHIGYEREHELKGFLLVRLLEGEYGESMPLAVLDVIGVEPDYQGQGIGASLIKNLKTILREKGIIEVQSQADWRNLSILNFFSKAGFQLAPKQVLEREVSYMTTMDDLEQEQSGSDRNPEKDFSDPRGDETGSLSHDMVICRSLEPDDMPVLIRIYRKVTGQDRSAYYERKVNEVLNESGIRVSLVGELDGQVVGFIMARVDYGEYDRTEPIAVLDTIGVHPDFGNRNVGSALLARLLGNLATLRLEKVRTQVDANHFDVLSFLMKNGFRPSQELAFSCTVN